jgi:hypothetical protein
MPHLAAEPDDRMIRYSLRCAHGHAFESWFQSAAAFDTLTARQAVTCIECGTAQVEKSLMAPSVATAAQLHQPKGDREAAVAALRRHVEENSDYVGLNFVTEARRMHAGELPERAIHGEARLDEARALLEEGVPVAPLPFLPARKVN